MKESVDLLAPDEARGEPEGGRKRGLVRRVYNWTIHWAETPYGPWALFVLAFCGSSFFPLPPDALLIALALGAPRKSLRFAAVCTAGSVLGGILGFVIGRFLFETVGRSIVELYGVWEEYHRVKNVFQNNGFLWILLAALTPIPYKVFTIAAGVCNIQIGVLLLASVVGRGVRFFAQGLLFQLFGVRIKKFIDRYFNLLTVLFFLLLVAGFVFVRILWADK